MRLACTLCLLAAPAAAEISLSSTLPGIEIAALHDLPPPPAGTDGTDPCPLLPRDPMTPGGLAARSLGWQVTAELPLGPLTAVSLAEASFPAPGGLCLVEGGRIAIFADDRPVALIAPAASDPDAGLTIGRIRPLAEGRLRLLTGDLLTLSLGDLVLDGTGLAVQAPAPEEAVCGGAARVPFVEGQPIDAARLRVIAAGWSPVPFAPDEDTTYQARALHALGLPEIAQCDSTGPAFCSFRYDSPAGRLTLVTQAEPAEDASFPAVVRFWVDCRESD